jgi:hypothetical protein
MSLAIIDNKSIEEMEDFVISNFTSITVKRTVTGGN